MGLAYPLCTILSSPLSPIGMASSASALPLPISAPRLSFSRALTPNALSLRPSPRRRAPPPLPLSVSAQALDFTGSFFEGGRDEDTDGPSAASAVAVAEKEEPQCPPGLRQYETMAVLRPDMTEDERLNLTQRYEELLVAGGGMYVEVFNRGVIPLAYSIKKRNKAGETNTYLDGIYLLFTYFTKPDSMDVLTSRLNTDDDVIRWSFFKIRKRKY